MDQGLSVHTRDPLKSYCRQRAAFVGALLAAMLAGCGTLGAPQSAALIAQAPASLPSRAELTSVPFFPQTPYHCGPAALATVLGPAGLPASPEALADAVFLPAREGALQTEMLAATRRRGALALPLPPTFEALLREVAAGRPVVILQNLGLAFTPRWHYAVLVGYDLGQREVILRSGTTERERMDFVLFERTWARGGHWAFVALAPGRLAATAREADAVAAAIAFERTAPPAQVLLVYDSLVERWPDNLLAGLGQGNMRFGAGDLDGAARALERVADRHDSAPAWNNLAQVRWQLGRRDAALDAARRAVARAETAERQWLDAARQTLALVQPAGVK